MLQRHLEDGVNEVFAICSAAAVVTVGVYVLGFAV